MELKKIITPDHTQNILLRRLQICIIYPIVLLLFVFAMFIAAIIDAIVSLYKFIISEWGGAAFHIKDQFQDIKKLWRKDYDATKKPYPGDDL